MSEAGVPPESGGGPFDSIRCNCEDCIDGRRAPMGRMNGDGTATFERTFGGKKHRVTVSINGNSVVQDGKAVDSLTDRG